MKNTDNDSIPEVQFYETVDTKSSLKFKPLNSSLEVAECKQIIDILDKPTMLNQKQFILVKICKSENIFWCR